MSKGSGRIGGAGISADAQCIDSVGGFFESAVDGIERLTVGLGCCQPGVSFGRLDGSRQLFHEVQKQYGVRLAPGFEDNDNVSGGVFRGADVFGNDGDDALLLLAFQPGTLDLPLHVHEHSDRFIAVGEGGGFFHFLVPEGVATEIRSRPVGEGDIIAFTRGLVHTFSAPRERLRLLSYHTPFFDLADPRQWSVPPDVKRLQPVVDAFHRSQEPRAA